MSTGRGELTNPRRRLPDLSLVSETSGVLTRLTGTGRPASVLVLLLLHDDACDDCRAYVELLARERQTILGWDARVVVVRAAPARALATNPSRAASPFLALSDPDGRLTTLLSTSVPAVVVADQWRVIHTVEAAGSDHHFISPAEIAEWAKYLAVQCPECEGEAL